MGMILPRITHIFLRTASTRLSAKSRVNYVSQHCYHRYHCLVTAKAAEAEPLAWADNVARPDEDKESTDWDYDACFGAVSNEAGSHLVKISNISLG